jgi:cysteinyl-tRNA synthetase
MSKSKGNFYKLEDIEGRGYSAMELRLALLSAHYRSQMNFTWSVMDQAKVNFKRIIDFVNNLIAKISVGSEVSGEDSGNFNTVEFKERFEKAMDDDLNTPLALSVVYELITETNKLIAENKLTVEDATKILKLWEKMNKVFGLIIPEEIEISEEVRQFLSEREEARNSKNWKRSDEIRDLLLEKGYVVKDTADGQVVKGKN